MKQENCFHSSKVRQITVTELYDTTDFFLYDENFDDVDKRSTYDLLWL